MGNFICSVSIIVLMVIFVTVNSVIICNICNDIIHLIDEGDIESAAALWEKRRGYVALFVRDAEIDVATAEARRLKEALSSNDGEIETIAFSFRDAVTEVKNSERVNFQGLF